MALFSIPAAAALALSCLFVYKVIVQPLFFSRLSSIPAAHPLARFTPLWILWKRWRSQENAAIYDAHKRYGEVVLLGPNELSVNCIDNGIRTVYGGGFEKHEFYANLFTNYDGVHTMFSTLGSRPHASRKRMLTNVYSKSYIHSSPAAEAISQRITYERLLPSISRHASKGEPIEIHHLVGSATMDFVTAYKFGLRNSSNFLDNPTDADWWLYHYLRRKKSIFYVAEMPSLSSFLTTYLGVSLWPRSLSDSTKQLEDWCMGMCEATSASESAASPLPSEAGDEPENVPVIYRQLKASMQSAPGKSSYAPLQDNVDEAKSMASELLDNLAAGHETSAVVLTYLFYQLALDLPLQAALRRELMTLSPRITLPSRPDKHTGDAAPLPALPSAKQLDALPLLHSVLMETLRLHAAIPGPQPRVTPASGCQLGRFTDIPGGMRVSANAWSLHRNAEVFEGPEEFRARRWLDASAAQKAEMQRWFWAFGSGGRMCIGSNLAMMQMKLIAAAVCSCYRLEGGWLPERHPAEDLEVEIGEKGEGRALTGGGGRVAGTRDGEVDVEKLRKGMRQQDAYTAQPKSGGCLLNFVAWGQD